MVYETRTAIERCAQPGLSNQPSLPQACGVDETGRICFRHGVSLIKKRELLQRAAELMGRDQLALRLSISETLLDAWIRGGVAMPDGKLFVLAAILEKRSE